MKKTLMAAALLVSTMGAHAEAPGGPDCGWGNLVFEGQNGLPSHLLASIVNGTSGNASFGMTSGTNGCSTDGTLSYGGDSLLAMNGVLEEVAMDMAKGDGEALTALSVSYGVEANDRAHFKQVMHENFQVIFTDENTTAREAAAQISQVMERDQVLAKYI